MKKTICLFVALIFVTLLSAGCKSSEHESEMLDPGPGPGDMNNLYENDGKILMSKDSLFILYMNPDGSVEGMFENEDEMLCHFYVCTFLPTVTSRYAALVKDKKDEYDFHSYRPSDEVYMYCFFIDKSDREIVQVHDGSDSTQFKAKREEIVLRQLDLEPSETAEYFKKLQTLPKDQWPEVNFKTDSP